MIDYEYKLISTCKSFFQASLAKESLSKRTGFIRLMNTRSRSMDGWTDEIRFTNISISVEQARQLDCHAEYFTRIRY